MGTKKRNEKVERRNMQLDQQEDITSYLSTMKMLLKNNKNFVVVSETKDKNFIFMYLYRLSKDDIKDCLLSIKESEFKEKIYSTHPDHLGEELYVWSPTRTLVAQDGSMVDEKLYIKTYIDEMKRLVVVISFHRYGDIQIRRNKK